MHSECSLLYGSKKKREKKNLPNAQFAAQAKVHLSKNVAWKMEAKPKKKKLNEWDGKL